MNSFVKINCLFACLSHVVIIAFDINESSLINLFFFFSLNFFIERIFQKWQGLQVIIIKENVFKTKSFLKKMFQIEIEELKLQYELAACFNHFFWGEFF